MRTEILERLRRSRDWSSVIDELEREAEGVSSEQERSEMLFELGALSEEVVPERERALAIYQRAWKLYPQNIKALTRAREVYRELGRLEMVAKVGELELKMRQGDGAAAELACLVGEALLDCGQRDRALPILEMALQGQPDSTRVKDALAAANYDPDDWIDAVERLSTEAERADETTAARMLLRAARIVHLETPEDEMYERLLNQTLKICPHDESANFLFEQLMSERERWDDLEQHQLRRGDALDEPKARAELYRRFALEWVQRFKDRERAARFFRLAVESSSKNGSSGFRSLVAAFSLFREFYGNTSDWGEFLTLAETMVDRTKGNQRFYVALQAGLIAWKEMDDPERARPFFEVVQELEPESPDLADYMEATSESALASSETILAEGTRPPDEDESYGKPTDRPVEEQVAAPEAEAEAVAEPEATAEPEPEPQADAAEDDATVIAPVAAEIEHEREEEIPAEVTEAMEAARNLEADSVDKAIEAWRKIVQSNAEFLAPRLGYIGVLISAERWNAAVEALKDAEQKAAQTKGERIALLSDLVKVYRQVKNDVMVVNTLTQMHEIRPADVGILDTLASQYESMKRWPDLVKTLQQKAELLETDAERIEIHLDIARLYINRFSNQAEAIKAFERVLEFDPDNQEATEHLLEVYKKRRDWEKLIGLKEREIDREEDLEKRGEMILEVAKLAATRVKKPEICTVWWEKVLDDDPAHEEAIGELEKFYERAKNWEKLAEICTKKAVVATDEKKQVDALQKLGLLYTDKVENPDKAIEAWRRLLDIDSSHRRAQDALKKAYIATHAWDELEEFYRSAGRLDEFVRVLERQVDADGQSDEERVRMATRIAVTYRDEIEKADRAMRAFEKVLSIDENNLEAAEALIPLYEKGRDPRKLVRALEIQLAATEDQSLRRERLERLAEYSEERLRDKAAAFGWWLKAHAENHDVESIREHAERLARETGCFAELVDGYRQSYEKFDSREDALPLMLVVAAMQEQELGEIDAALETNREILEVDSVNPAAVAALERLYIGKERFGDLLEIYQRKLDLAETQEARTEIQFKIGQLYEEEIKDDDKAVEAYRDILEENGSNTTALRALDRLYVRREQWNELAETLQREIDLISFDENAEEHLELMYRLGRVREQYLEDVGSAIEMYRAILNLSTDHVGAREALEARLRDEAHRLEAADILHPIYEGLEEWSKLVDAHEIQLAAKDDQLERVGLLMRIGELHSRRLGDADRAFDAYARAFREEYSSENAKAQLEELCGLIDEGWPKLVQLFEEAVDSADIDPVLRHELCTKIAQAYMDRLDNTDKAVQYFRTALQIEPDDRNALEALDLIFTRDEKYPELLEVYRKKADISVEPDERLAILFRIAAIHEEMLQSPQDAIETYNEVLANDGENQRALKALDRLYLAGNQWQELADNLVSQLTLCESDGERVELLIRLAELREAQLAEAAAAIETYRQVLELDPYNERAIAALERMIKLEEQELVVAQLLEPIYKASAEWQKQVAVYEIMARHAYDPERKIELLHSIAELHELGGDSSSTAFETYARAFRDEPRSTTTQAQLDRLARVLDRWPDLVALYDEVAQSGSDEELRVALLTRLAQIYELELQNDESAVRTYERILEASPSQVDAATAIEQIHERNAAYPELVAALVRKSEILAELDQRKGLLHKAAKLQEEVLEDPEGAIKIYNSVLELDDLDVVAINALERLYIRLERWGDLKDVYAKKADLAEDPEDKRKMLHVLGQVYDRELRDNAKAIETYQAILDIDDHDIGAIQALDRLFSQAERWYDLLQNLEHQVELSQVPHETVGLKYRIGVLWRQQLSDLTRSIESYSEALQIDPAHHETLVDLEALLVAEEGEPVMAARVLEPIYEANGEFAKLVTVLEVLVKHAEDPETKVQLLHRLAQLLEFQLERHGDAFEAFGRALREDSGNETTIGQLDRLAEMTGNWAALGELYGAEADKSLDVPRQVDLLTRLARICEDELGQPDRAIDIFKRILDAEFDNAHAVLALDRLYTQAERWQELTEILRKEITLSDDDQMIGLQFRLGQTLEQALKDFPAAIEVYREILSTDPEHDATIGALEMMFLDGNHELEISQILEPLYENAGAYEKLHKIYEVQLSKLTDVHDRQGMFQRLAELAEGQLSDFGRAFAWWGEALCEDPTSEQAFEEAERLATGASLWPNMAEVYGRVLERHNEPDARRRTLLRLARVLDIELGDAQQAIGTYLAALEIDDRDPDALAALDRIYAGAGMYEELVDILRRRIEITLDGDEIVQLHLRRGQIYADALADLDQALSCYESVLEQDSRNRAALEAEETIYFRREEWTNLFAVYEKLVDVSEGDEELAEVYARMARISSDATDDKDAAVDLWLRVVDIRGEDPLALAELADLYGQRENWEELVDIIERQVGVAADPTFQATLYKRLGRVWSERLGRERNALEAWLQAFERDPNDLQTLAALAHIYRATQSWEELSQILRRMIAVGLQNQEISEDGIISLYSQLGQLEGEMLGRIDESVEAWRQVTALDPTDFRALRALEQLFTREARWEECIEVLERRALVLDDPAKKLETLLQAAATWEEKVENLPKAAEVYERVRNEDAGNAIASARLEAIYRQLYQWEALNEVLLARVEHTEELDGRIDILQAVAKVYEEELGDQESAFVVLEAAFKEDYAHESTARELERLATAAGKWGDLLQDYTEVVQSLEGDEPEKACDLWVKIGRWYADHAQHVDYAIHSVQQALRLNNEHLGALGALADFQRKRGSWHELVEVLGRHAGIEPDPDRKVELYSALADLLETQLQDPDQAIRAYQAALEADPTCLDALISLDRLHRQRGDWEHLIDVLGRMGELRNDPQDVIGIKLEIGQLWDERLVDSGQAIRSYQEVLDLDPTNISALRALESLYEKTGQSEQYLDILEAQLDASPTDAEQISLYERMASAWEERFGKLDRAAECLEKIVVLDERNFAAYKELARLYRQESKFDSLVDTYRRHIMAVADTATRIDLYCAMGEVYEFELGDYDRGIEAYSDVLTFEPNEPRALDALGRLYERIEEWDRAIDVMQQLVNTTGDTMKQVDLFYRIGRITHQHLGESEQAEQRFLNALTLFEGHVPTMEELVRLYADRGDWLKAAQMMVRAESFTQNLLDKVRLLFDAARIYLDKLERKEEAKQYFSMVMALDPEHVEAAEPLAELFFQDEQWSELTPILDMLVRKASQRNLSTEELRELYYRTAKCANELRDFDRAVHFYKQAYEIDSTYLPVLIGRADLLYNMEDWDGAGKIYQTILVQHRDSQNEGDVVRTYYRLGMVRHNLGERKKALNMFEKALEIDPNHADTLNAVIGIQEQQGDYEAVIHAKRGLIATATEDDAVRLLDEIGDVYHQQLQNPQKAIGAYHEALEMRPEDHQLLQKLLDLYTETEHWKNAVEIIERFVALEADPLRRGSYYQAAGTICRDKIKAIDEAIEFYNKALDNFFSEGSEKIPESFLSRALKPFQDIDKILTNKKDWKNQERAYRKMIKRLRPGDTILIKLWHALGEIYRSRLKQYEAAIAAFEVAQQLDADNNARREILAELYVLSGGDYADRAATQHLEMLRVDPFKYDSYKALRRIYMDSHQYDKTWCVCNTLSFLKQADAEEVQFYEQYKPRGFVKAKARMTEEIWRAINHRDENPYVGAIFAAIWRGAAMMRAQPHKAYGLKRKDRMQVENDKLQFSRIFYYVNQVLNVPLPDLYLQSGQQGEIMLANAHEKGVLIPSFVVGGSLLQGRSDKEIAFISSKWLTYLRPDHFLKLALPTNTELKVAFLSALRLVRPDFPIPGDLQALVAQYLPQMQKVMAQQPSWLEQLNMVVDRFIKQQPEINLAKWGAAVDTTAHRAGFLLCGDLEVAANLVSMEPAVVGGPQAKDKVKELVLFSVSDEYYQARQHLGLTIG